MIWQDATITAANIIFSISLLPQIFYGFKKKKGFISPWTSGPTVIGLFAIAYALFTLKLYFSSIMSAISALLWLTLFIQERLYKKA